MIDIINDTPEIIEIHVQDPPDANVVCVGVNAFFKLEPGHSQQISTVETKNYSILARTPGRTTGEPALAAFLWDVDSTFQLRISSLPLLKQASDGSYKLASTSGG